MSSTNPAPQLAKGEAEPSKRSCIKCNQRKVRCDKNHPCFRCTQAEVECIYPGNKRAPRKLNRPPMAAIRARLQKLEEEVQRLQTLSHPSNTNDSPVLGHQPDPQINEENLSGSGTSRGMLLVQDESKSRYVGNEASVVLGDKIPGFRELYGQAWEKGNIQPTHSTLPSPLPVPLARSPGSNPQFDSTQFRPRPQQMEILWRIYKTNVAPMIAVLHKPSIESLFREACAKPDIDLGPESEALIRVIFFAAIVSVIPLQCQASVGKEHGTCIHEYRFAVEQSLARANLISSNDVRVLQAAAIYLLCLRCVSDSRQVWAEAALVVRVAQSQGIHRDGQSLGLSPFETEMRRRLWWHICILDMLCSEDQGTDAQIRPDMFDTKPPLNIDSDDLAPSLVDLPSPQAGFTDITLCIIQTRVLSDLTWTGKSINSGSNPSSVQRRHETLTELAVWLEERFVLHFDLEDPVQWVVAVIARLTLSKASLISHLSSSAPNKQSTAADDDVLSMAVEILEFTSLLQNNELSSQWAWLCKGYQQQHAVALILSEICARPISPETNHAWDLVKNIYNGWQNEKRATNSQLEEPLSLLMERASISMMEKSNALGL